MEYRKLLLYVLLFVPLFFINIRNSHDWGDDFAQYIKQASNIAEGKPQSETGYIFNPDQPFVDPPTYAVGFPLLLAPICLTFGNNLKAFNYFNTFLLLVFGLLMVYFFRRSFSGLIAVLLSVMIIYNPWTIRFKCEIISDIAFSVFFMLCMQLYSKSKQDQRAFYRSGVLGVLVGFLILIRSIGIVFVAAVLFDMIFRMVRNSFAGNAKESNALFINLAFMLGSCTAVFFVVGNVLFPVGSNTLGYFKTLYSYQGLKEVFLKNLTYYVENFQFFFQPQTTLWSFVPLLMKASALSFFLVGFINALLRRITFMEVLLLIYVASICFFPNSTQGFRYLLPVLPLLMYYIVTGIQAIRLSRAIHQKMVAVSIAVVCILTYRTELTQIIMTQKQTIQGAQEPEAVEAFNFIKANTKAKDTIVFIKPRALALYTGRHSFTNHQEQDSISLAKRYSLLKPHYFLLMSDIENQALKNYIHSNAPLMQLLFRNSKFEFYKQLSQ